MIPTKWYGAWDDGDSCRWDQRSLLKGNNPSFEEGDIVEMVLDLIKQEISMKVNDGDKSYI